MNKLLRLLLIRKDEKQAVFYFLTFFFIVGCGLAFGKASSEALFFKRYGIEHLPAVYIALGVALAIVSLIYVSYADRIAAEKFFFYLFALLATMLVFIWNIINQPGMDMLYPVYFLLYEIVSEIILLHSALYISQNFDSFKSKRLAPVILAGGQLGLITGGILVAILAPAAGTNALIKVWIILLVVAMSLLAIRHFSIGTSAYFFKQNSVLSVSHSIQRMRQGLQFSKKSPLLGATLLSFFFLVISFYILYFVTNSIYTSHFKSEESLTAFFGVLTAATGLLGLLIQLLITNRLVKRFGVPKVNLIFPTLLLSSFSLLLIVKLPAALFGSFIKDSLHPALNTPLRNMIFNVLPKNIQGRIRAVLLGVIIPTALIICASILLIAQSYQNTLSFLLAGILISLLMLLLSFKVSRLYLSTLIQHLKEQVFLPEECLKQQDTKKMLKEFAQHIEQPDELLISYSRVLLKVQPAKTSKIIEQHLHTLPDQISQELLTLIAEETKEETAHYLQAYSSNDNNKSVNKQLLTVLFNQHNNAAANFISPLLDSNDFSQMITGIYGAMSLNQQTEKASNLWADLMKYNHQSDCIVLIKFIEQLAVTVKQPIVASYHDFFKQMILATPREETVSLLKTLSQWPATLPADITSHITNLQKDSRPQVRQQLVHCLHLLPEHEAMILIVNSLDDPHASVREAAVEKLFKKQNDHDDLALQWLTDDNYLSIRAQHSLLQHLITPGLKQQTLKKISSHWARKTRKLYDAKHMVKSSSTTAEFLLVTTIEERLQQALQFLLTLMSASHNSDVIAVIQAAIYSKDKLLIASASEALKCLNNTTVSELILDILQDDFELKNQYSFSFNSTDDAIEWCSRLDEWLNLCAMRVLQHA